MQRKEFVYWSDNPATQRFERLLRAYLVARRLYPTIPAHQALAFVRMVVES
jgi:hypothetical protein